MSKAKYKKGRKIESLPDSRSKNQKKKDRKKYFKQKRKMRGNITIELPREKSWHERIVIKEKLK